MFRITSLMIGIILLLAACHSPESAPPPSVATPVRTLEWDELMPADFEPEAIFKDVDIASLADDSPRAQELMIQLRTLWDAAPVVEALDGLRVRLPGFAIPLEGNGKPSASFCWCRFTGPAFMSPHRPPIKPC
jgi:hypothetical protein